MAVKIDKDVLIKHHFWILTGAFFLFALIPLLVLATSVGATVNKEKNTLAAEEKKVRDLNNPKNDKWVVAYKKQEVAVDGKKNEVWGQAWQTQKDLMTFPERMTATFKGLYFGDDVEPYERQKFRDEYRSQLVNFEQIVQPVNNKGVGAVQAPGGPDGWGAFLTLDIQFQQIPTKEDIWLAQEDLWVKRELLRVVRDANDSVARFTQVKPGKETPPKIDPLVEPVVFGAGNDSAKAKPASVPDEPNHKVFRNQTWQLDVALAQNSSGKNVLKSKLTNITNRKQYLGETVFKVFVQRPGPDQQYAEIHINGEPMAAGDTLRIPDQVIPDQVPVDHVYGVEQVFNWRSAPVKRIDKLVIGHFSSRTANRKLVGPRFITDANPEGNKPAEQQRSGRLGSEGGGPGSAGGGSSTSTPSGLAINRYIDRNEQVRHMPVAMALVVKEENIPDVLAAFTNSKLRIEVTQFHWDHFRGSVQPQLLETPGAPAPGPAVAQAPGLRGRGGRVGEMAERAEGPRRGPVASGRLAGGGEGGDPRGMGVGVQFRPGGGQNPSGNLFGNPTGTGTQSADQEEDMGLVEISVYGIASLYEKFPAKTPVEAGGAQPKPAPK
jgi:hypothetical protein